MKLAINIWKRTVIALCKNRKLLVPFVISAGFSGLVLYILYLAPSRPVSLVLAPPIRAFFGEKFLHYPYSIYLLPKLFYYAQLLVNSTIGLIMTGLAIGFVKDAYNKEELKTPADLAVSFKRYFTLLGIWAIMFLSMFVISELVKRAFPAEANQLLIDCLVYIAGILAQLVFIYAMPIAILEKKGFLGSLKQGFLFFKKFFFTTIVLIIVPAAIYLPLLILNQYVPKLINKLWPEVVIIALGLGILATFIIDIFFTCAPAFLLLQNKDEK